MKCFSMTIVVIFLLLMGMGGPIWAQETKEQVEKKTEEQVEKKTEETPEKGPG